MGDDEGSQLGRFGTQLASDDVDVVRLALDDFLQAQADTRWGVDNPYRPIAGDVRFAARDLLDLPPSGESHVSALRVLWHLADEEDARRIVGILEGAPDAEVRELARDAARTALTAGDEPDRRLLDLLVAEALDDGLDTGERVQALRGLAGLDSPEVEDVLVRLTESPEFDLQVYAAGHLATPLALRTHRERLERLAKSWPEDAGWSAREVRRALEGFHSTHLTDTAPADPALRRAHDELMFPPTDDACLNAFTTLLRSDDPVAVGIALDHYESSEGLCRVLEDEERAVAYLPEVLARAREVLRLPMPRAEVSALAMIGGRHVDPGDAELLRHVLTRTDSEPVRRQALWTAGAILKAAEVPDAQLVAAMSDTIFDPSVGTKETAVRILADSLGADADDILLRALREGEPKVQAHAANYLIDTGGLARHRPILEEVAESWGDQVPDRPFGRNPVDRIFGTPHSVHWKGHRLADPGLARAHRRLRAPDVDESYHAALRMLLDSGDDAAVGIALDHWWSPDGAERRGGPEAREPETALVLRRAREALSRPAAPPELSRDYGPDAKHLGALAALSEVAERSPSLLADAVELADIILATPSWYVRDRAFYIVDEVFQVVEEADPRFVDALGILAHDDGVPEDERARAAELLAKAPGPGR
ncbi:HEAT repeat domain-containing protein [Yinghuangia sp. YIM S09857]|uniref:HEAT repeat domain-containing protein n=1 Tax=Yinghuangia sp. YIM S09857 TaxID=3436929 RepID=UPI003F53B77D